jgi:phenylalanyl-tRNA synthetase alpha subunit
MFLHFLDPHDLNNDEYIRPINTRFPPTAKSNRVSNTLSQKSPLSPHRDSLKFTYVTNMRQRTVSVANAVTNTATIPEAPPLPTSLTTAKPKTSWPPPTTVLNSNTNSSTISTSNNSVESSNNSLNEARRRKTSSSDNKSSRKESDSQLPQQPAFDSFDGSVPQSSTASSSIHFIQRTLNQHALQIIAKGRLRHLGYMAANIADFDLLNWLRTHKYEYFHLDIYYLNRMIF